MLGTSLIFSADASDIIFNVLINSNAGLHHSKSTEYHAVQALEKGTDTPKIGNGNKWYTNQSGAQDVIDFSAGTAGATYTFIGADGGLTTFKHATGRIFLNKTGGDIILGDRDVLTLECYKNGGTLEYYEV